MTRKWRTIALLLVVISHGRPATAVDFVTGNTLHERAESGREVDEGYLLGYTAAVNSIYATGDARLYCPPEQTTLVQMKDVVLKYLKEHPGMRHLNGTAAVRSALIEAFPCD